MFPDIATKKGDDGTTSLLLGEGKVAKSHPRILANAYLDMANLELGALKPDIRFFDGCEQLLEDVETLQRRMTLLMGEIASENDKVPVYVKSFDAIGEKDVLLVESIYDRLKEVLDSSGVEMKDWILYGNGFGTSVQADRACKAVRIAECHVVGLAPRKEIIAFLNRLSDMLFLLARVIEKGYEYKLQ